MKRIILCADDFGQSPAISRGILQLVRAARLSAVSCMTEADAWRDHGAALAQHAGTIDIGLHFNLTHPLPAQQLAARPLGAVLSAALSGRIDAAAVTAALHAQLDRFEETVGAPPHFVDGHQHVHVFPGIRHALLDALAARYPRRGPYLRNVNPHLGAGGNPLRDGAGAFKTGLLKLLNIGFARAALRRGLPCTRGFGGIYSLRPSEDYGALMRRWLAAANDADLLMCHPGLAASDAADPIAAARSRELQYLSSAEFAEHLHAAGVALARFERPEKPF